MPDLKYFYNQRVDELHKTELLKQVGHSVKGNAITDQDYSQIIMDITDGLQLTSTDVLLDLCCGNGVITCAFADQCAQINGIDLSDKMIDLAIDNNKHNNLKFINGDIWNLAEHFNGVQFTKVMMFGSLQHFQPRQFERLLTVIMSVCAKDFLLFFGFVTNMEFKWQFYNTWQKKFQHFYRRLSNKEFMGYWWQKQQIKRICEHMNLNCHFVELKPDQYGFPYRFHVIINSKESP